MRTAHYSQVLEIDSMQLDSISSFTIEELQKAQEADTLYLQEKYDIDGGLKTPYVED